MTITQQTAKEKLWKDEAGNSIPFNRLTKAERTKESLVYKMAAEAIKANEALVALKYKMKNTINEIVEAIVTENNGIVKETKGNLTLYNFNGSIKVETSVNDRIDFDSVLLDQCKQKLDELLTNSLSSSESFIKEIVMGAFETSRGKLDTKKVLALKKYTTRIKNPLYQEAMELLDKSIRRPDSRTYYRVSVKDAAGKFQLIDLNFSSIDIV